MVRNSIDVVEQWFGQEIHGALPTVITKMPDNQLTELWSELADSYYAWDGAWLAEAQEGPSLLHFAGREEHETGSEGWLNAIKSASLYFDGLIFRDPLAERLHSVTEVAGLLGEASRETVVRDLVGGIRELETIRPLVRTGAIRIAPRTFLGLLPDVQELARMHLGEKPAHFEREDGFVDTEPAEFASVSALCAKFGFEPIAGSKDGLRILQNGIKRFPEVAEKQGLGVRDGFKSLSIPNVNRVPLEEIIRLRANSDGFARVRREIKRAMRVAEASLAHNEPFEIAFAEELRDVQERLAEEIGRSKALQELVVPLGASVGMGMFGLLFGSLEPDRVAAALASSAAPGVAWIANMLLAALSAKGRGEREIVRLYGHLIS